MGRPHVMRYRHVLQGTHALHFLLALTGSRRLTTNAARGDAICRYVLQAIGLLVAIKPSGAASIGSFCTTEIQGYWSCRESHRNVPKRQRACLLTEEAIHQAKFEVVRNGRSPVIWAKLPLIVLEFLASSSLLATAVADPKS